MEMRLSDVSHLISDWKKGGNSTTPPIRCYVDRDNGWSIQVFNDTHGCRGTPWNGTLRVGVTHTRAERIEDFHKRGFGIPISWDELQKIKNHFWGDRIAIEIYPPRGQVVDAAEMRWLWVLPKGASLPFNLCASSPTVMQS